jgi:hypothetical protein
MSERPVFAHPPQRCGKGFGEDVPVEQLVLVVVELVDRRIFIATVKVTEEV